MPNLLVTATTRYDPKGLNKAKKDIKGFDKSIKSLGKAFAGVFAAQKVLAFGKASVKAFAADDKAAKILAKSLDNLGVSYANPAVKDYIAGLETQFGVLDDKLRPAYQKLLTTTGDWRKSQDLLATSLDLSAMSGLDLQSVAGDLSKAYAGNTRGLMKYGLGLSKTQLAGMKFEDILKQIAKISGGQAALAADTFAGKLDKLNVAAQNAKETIGKGLVQAMSELAGANGFDGALKGINDLAQGISDAIIGFERLITIAGFFVYNKKGTNPFTQMNEFNAANAKTDMLQRQKFGGAAANAYISAADKVAAKKLANQKADELALLTAKNKATKEEAQMKKDQAALDALKAKFDLERIGLNAALLNATDEETKARIKAQIAILDESGKTAQAANDALVKAQADKLKNELAAADALSKLATATGLTTTALYMFKTALTPGAVIKKADTIDALTSGIPPGIPPVIPPGIPPVIPPGIPPVIPPGIPPGIPPVIPPGIPPVIPPVEPIPPILIPDAPFIPIPGFPGIGTDKETKDAVTEIIKGIVDDSVKPGDFFSTDAVSIPPTLFGELDTAALGALIDAINSFANAKDGGITVTINDNTSGLIEIVQDAVVDNTRNGNNLFVAGSI